MAEPGRTEPIEQKKIVESVTAVMRLLWVFLLTRQIWNIIIFQLAKWFDLFEIHKVIKKRCDRRHAVIVFFFFGSESLWEMKSFRELKKQISFYSSKLKKQLWPPSRGDSVFFWQTKYPRDQIISRAEKCPTISLKLAKPEKTASSDHSRATKAVFFLA